MLGETCSRYPSAKHPRVGLLLHAAPAESWGAAIVNPFGSRNGNVEEYAKGAVVAMFSGTRWGGACFVGRDVFISGGGGAAGRDDGDDNFVSRLYPWWLVG